MVRTSSLLVLCAYVFFGINAPGRAENLHLIDSSSTGFEIYRSGRPSEKDYKQWCDLGVNEVLVLSTDDRDQEQAALAKYCPSSVVIKAVHQESSVPLTSEFLDWFDSWVQNAQDHGKKILFHCECGCHRTGRLGAYFRFRFQNESVAFALTEYYKLGRDFARFPFLVAQIKALKQYTKNQVCLNSVDEESRNLYCVNGQGIRWADLQDANRSK